MPDTILSPTNEKANPNFGVIYSKSADDLEKFMLGTAASASSFKKKAASDIGEGTEGCGAAFPID